MLAEHQWIQLQLLHSMTGSKSGGLLGLPRMETGGAVLIERYVPRTARCVAYWLCQLRSRLVLWMVLAGSVENIATIKELFSDKARGVLSGPRLGI